MRSPRAPLEHERRPQHRVPVAGPQGAGGDLRGAAVGHAGHDRRPRRQPGLHGGGGADLAEAGAGRDDRGQQVPERPSKPRRPFAGRDVVAALQGVAAVRGDRLAGEPAGDDVGLVGEPQAGRGARRLVAGLEQPVQLGQRPGGRQVEAAGLLGRAGVVVHERRAVRPAVAVDEQDRARGGARRDAGDARGGDGARRRAAGRGDGLPPARRVLLVAVAVAPAAQRVRPAPGHRSVGGDGERPRAARADVDSDADGRLAAHSRWGPSGSGGGAATASGASRRCHHDTSRQAPCLQPIER